MCDEKHISLDEVEEFKELMHGAPTNLEDALREARLETVPMRCEGPGEISWPKLHMLRTDVDELRRHISQSGNT